jgi:hypothetical protein
LVILFVALEALSQPPQTELRKCLSDFFCAVARAQAADDDRMAFFHHQLRQNTV